MMKRVWTVLLAVVFASSVAWAQDDEELAPLAPIGKPKPKPKAKPKPRAQPKTQTKKTTKIDDDDELAPLAPIATSGNLNVKSPAGLSGAVLSVDGREIGTLPMPAQALPPGEHTVTVKRPGYAAFVKKVLVTGGKTVDVDARLTAVSAVLSVSSDVDGAQVLLNGRNIGTAPLKDVEVPAGPAEVAVIKEGFKEDAQKINFIAGKDYPVVVRFNPGETRTLASDRPVANTLTPLNDVTPVGGVTAKDPEPITTKWYFWTGVAVVVVAAAAVTTAVVVGNNNATAPAPPPEQVCGGMCDDILNF